MYRKTVFITTLILLCSATWHGARSEGLLNTSPEAKKLIGSKWILTEKSDKPLEIEFGKNDELITNQIPLGRGAKPWWSLEGKDIELVFNNGLSIYKGKMVNKNEMKGMVTSRDRTPGKWHAKRITKSQKKVSSTEENKTSN